MNIEYIVEIQKSVEALHKMGIEGPYKIMFSPANYERMKKDTNVQNYCMPYGLGMGGMDIMIFGAFREFNIKECVLNADFPDATFSISKL